MAAAYGGMMNGTDMNAAQQGTTPSMPGSGGDTSSRVRFICVSRVQMVDLS